MGNFQKIIRQSYKIIKALAGNDESKSHMIKAGYANVIQESLNASLVCVFTLYQ